MRYLKQKVGSKRKLCENDKSTKNCLVLQQNGPIFKPLVDFLLPATNPLLYFSGVWIGLHGNREFHVGWGSALTASNRLFAQLQHWYQWAPEDYEVIPSTHQGHTARTTSRCCPFLYKAPPHIATCSSWTWSSRRVCDIPKLAWNQFHQPTTNNPFWHLPPSCFFDLWHKKKDELQFDK